MIQNKTLCLFVAGIFTLVLAINFASAVSVSDWSLTTDGTASNVNANLNAGAFTKGLGISEITFGATGASATSWTDSTSLDATDYFQITSSPKTGYDLTISEVDFGIRKSLTGPGTYQVQWSKNSNFSLPTTIKTATLTDDTEVDVAITGLNISVVQGETIYIRIFGYNAGSAQGTLRINDGTLKVQGTLAVHTTPAISTPEEITACTTTGNAGNDLKIKIDDIKVSGYGKDEEWLPLDEISIDIAVENDNTEDKIKNIIVGWGLYNTETGDWYIDDEENDFDLKDKDEKTIRVTFKLDDDVDELADGDYVLYVWANGELNDVEVCTSDSQDIAMQIETDFVILDDIKFVTPVECGMDLQISADVWNIGEDDQEGVVVVIQNPALGINEKVNIDDVDAFDNKKLNVMVKVPKDAEEKLYDLEFTVLNEDGEIYENDYDEDESKALASLKVEGNCQVELTALVSASLESGGKAGVDMVIKATVTNTGDKSASYTLRATGYTGWASSAVIEPTTFTLNSGEGAEALITLKVNKDATGEQTFNLEVLSGTELVVKQPVAVSIEPSGFSGFTLGENWYLWLIGALNVVLVIIIIIIAVRVAKS